MQSGNLQFFLHPHSPSTHELKRDWRDHELTTGGSKPDDTIRCIRGTHNRRAFVSTLASLCKLKNNKNVYTTKYQSMNLSRTTPNTITNRKSKPKYTTLLLYVSTSGNNNINTHRYPTSAEANQSVEESYCLLSETNHFPSTETVQ